MSSVKLDMPLHSLYIAKYLVRWLNINLSVVLQLVWPTAFKTRQCTEFEMRSAKTDIRSDTIGTRDTAHWKDPPSCSGSRKRDTLPIDENLGVRAIYVVNRGVVCDRKFIKITILIPKGLCSNFLYVILFIYNILLSLLLNNYKMVH